MHELRRLFQLHLLLFCQMIYKEMVADGHILVVGMNGESHHAHVGNVVFRPCEGDVEILFFYLSSQMKGVGNGVGKNVAHGYLLVFRGKKFRKASESVFIILSHPFREALIKSLSDFILVFLFNARNQSTRTASYLRRLMTQHWIKMHMKFDSAN